MNINIYNQFYNLFIFIATGVIIGVLFDCFRILRRTFKTPDVITYIEDIIFWILVGIVLLVSIFTFNNGEIRSYIFFGLIIGMTIYILTISKYFIKISVVILTFLKKILYFPFQIIYKFLKNHIIKPISSIFHKFIKKVKSKSNNKLSQNVANDNFPNN